MVLIISLDEITRRMIESNHLIVQSDTIIPGSRYVEALDSAKLLQAEGKGSDRFIYEEKFPKGGIRRVLRVVPNIKMGVTKHAGSDQYPFHIIKVHTPRMLTIRPAHAVRDTNVTEQGRQKWIITPGSDDSKDVVIRLRKNCYWYDVNDGMYEVGYACRYEDPDF